MISDEAVARLQKVIAARYEIVREIGRGGMGVVYEAEDRELARRVAMKIVDEKNAEAELTATLEHPGIVPVHDAGTLPDGRSFYIMKLVRGKTLAECGDGLQPVPLFLRICEPVAFAHSRGVVHCDLKPSNIMIGEFGEVLVMDWGIANRRGGTPGYIAPEQKLGDITPAADVFALGTILRHLVQSSAPRRLRKIIAQATAPRKEDRYVSARELAADVRAYLGSREAAARNRALIAIVAAYLAMRVIVLLITHH